MRFIKFSLAPRCIAHAHCDVPCGIYDPDQARIEAESCYKIMEKYQSSSDEVFRQRCIVVKEERADLAKRHLDILWHDYFKPEHAKKFPELHELFWQAAKQCSKVKQSVDVKDARKLIELIDGIAEIWRKSGGQEQSRLGQVVRAA